jgi:hypothetical protein
VTAFALDDATAATLEEAYAAFEAEDHARAGDLLASVAPVLPPELARPTWFDAALCALFVRDWPQARDRGAAAVRHVERGQGEPAFWNLATAATALRDWDLARDSWAGFGLDLEAGSGPIEGDGGPTCVRLTIGEVVWAMRIDPVRARVVNVPFDPSRRFGEIVLHGGAPSGERVVNGAAVPVFDEIELFEPSGLATLSVTITSPEPAVTEALAESFMTRGYGMEILNSRVDHCADCSAGTHVSERGEFAGHQPLFVAAPPSDAEAILTAWVAAGPGRSWSDLHPA